MAIKLFLTQESKLEINCLDQKNFSIDENGAMLVLPFRTVEKGPDHIVIDPGDKLSDTIEYILNELNKDKYTCELDPYLERYWRSYCTEKKKIRTVRNKEPRLRLESNIIRKIFKSSRKPLDHQIKGIAHAISVENAANFSIPGSGKTQIALGCYVYWKKKNFVEKALVIGPASCFEPWENESKECLKNPIRIIRWAGTLAKRRKIGSLISNTDLILITYQTACNDSILLEQLMRRYKTLLILDESHHVKNPNGARAQAVMRLSPYSAKRIILTGTPVPHSLLDIWTQFSFLWPSQHLLGDYYTFKQRLETKKNPIVKLKRELSPFLIRTTKKELGLPDITWDINIIQKENIPLEQRKIIELLELKTLVEARKFGLSDIDMNVLRKWRIARIIRLLQAASNPALLLKKIDYFQIEKEFDIDTSDLIDYINVFMNMKKMPAKVSAVVEETKSLIETGKKVIIWTWFVDNIHLLKKLLYKYNPLLLYGEIKPYEETEDSALEESRERNIHEFKKRKDRPLLLANPAACAESISLHKHCQDAIYLDRNFNCGQFLQSMDRIHRVGMPLGVTAVYHIPLINCAIERSVDKRLKNRQQDLYKLLSDPMPILGVDDELWVADTTQEVEVAFKDIVKEIRNEKRKTSI